MFVFEVTQGVDKFFLSAVVFLIEPAFRQVVDNEQIDSIPTPGIGEDFQQTLPAFAVPVSLNTHRRSENHSFVITISSRFGDAVQIVCRVRRANIFPGFSSREAMHVRIP